MKSAIRVAVLGAMLATATAAEAVPIVYLGQLNPGVPVAGVNTQVQSSESDPVGADYWSFHATAGSAVTLIGERSALHYDMSMWVFQGLFADTNDFGASFDLGDAPFADFGDDENPDPGPFGDPQIVFNAPVTGFYTVAVTNFLSSQGPPNPYTLEARGVSAPEPGLLALLGMGVAGLVRARRRQ
jgi:hypothetical protein